MTIPALLTAGAGCAGLFVAIFLALSPRRISGLARLADPPAAAPSGSLGEQTRPDPIHALRSRLQAEIGSRLDRSTRGARLAERLADADLSLRPMEWLLTIASGSVVMAGALDFRFRTVLLTPVGLVAGWILSGLVLRYRHDRRRRAFDRQLAPAILSISSGLKAGHTFGQAVDLVAKSAQPPMGPELARITREAQLGVPLVDALARMVHRNRSDDLQLMLTAVQIQMQVGGNLAQILDTIEFTIRERVRIKGEIKTITSQARVSGYILIALPFVLAGILSVIAPSYFGPMLHQTIGLIMLGVGGFFLLCGYGIIRKIVNVKV